MCLRTCRPAIYMAQFPSPPPPSRSAKLQRLGITDVWSWLPFLFLFRRAAVLFKHAGLLEEERGISIWTLSFKYLKFKSNSGSPVRTWNAHGFISNVYKELSHDCLFFSRLGLLDCHPEMVPLSLISLKFQQDSSSIRAPLYSLFPHFSTRKWGDKRPAEAHITLLSIYFKIKGETRVTWPI